MRTTIWKGVVNITPYKNNLRRIRMAEFLMNATDFALYLGIEIKAYNHYENGRRLPRLPVALEISYKLNRTVNDIWFKD